MAVECGADAVGLLRTELLVLDKTVFPDEDEQTRDLTEIFEILGDRPIVVRVLDAGGDKPVATLDVDEKHNGFLGIRGLRFLLAHPTLLHTQLRAICRAAAGHRVSVMAPMVTVASEVTAFRDAVDAAVESLRSDGSDHAAPEAVGVMVEVPAAALAADEICAVADFVSIGSNDLTSYTMAADRTEPGVADLLDPGIYCGATDPGPAVCPGTAATTPVAVCGEMAGMAEYAPGLVARGVWELSMAPARIRRSRRSCERCDGQPMIPAGSPAAGGPKSCERTVCSATSTAPRSTPSEVTVESTTCGLTKDTGASRGHLVQQHRPPASATGPPRRPAPGRAGW